MLVDCIDRLCGGLSEEEKRLCCHFSDTFLMLQVSVVVHSMKEILAGCTQTASAVEKPSVL